MPFIGAIIGAVVGAFVSVLPALVVSFAFNAIGKLLTKKPPRADMSGNTVSIRQAVSPWRVLYGSLRIGGIITYMQTTGTKNEYLHLVITLAAHEVQSIGTMYFDGVAVPVDGSGNATGNYSGFVFVEKNLGTAGQSAFSDLVSKSGGKWTSAHKQSGRAGVHVRLKYDQNKFQNGLPEISFDVTGRKVYDPRTTAWAYSKNAALCLMDYLTNPDFGLGVGTQKATQIQTTGGTSVYKYDYWFPNAENGIVYEYIVYVENIGSKNVRCWIWNGSAESPEVTVAPGEKKTVYTAIAGTGASMGVTFATDLASDDLDFLAFNPIIRRQGVEENIIAGHFFESAMGWSANSGATVGVYQSKMAGVEIDLENITWAANVCDEDVALKAGGTENRYECNGSFDLSSSPADIIQSMLTSMGGRLLYTGGVFQVFPAAYLTPVDTVDEDDFAGPMKVQTTRSARDLFNGAKGVFISPNDSWQPTDFPQYQDADAVVADGGVESWKDMTLNFTTSAAMAQRLAKIEVQRNRRQVQLTLPLKLAKYSIKALDVFQLSFARYGWVNKTFEAQTVEMLMDESDNSIIIGTTVTAVETDADVYDWTAADDEVAHPTGSNITLSDPQTVGVVSGLSVSEQIVKSPDGVNYLAALLTWTAPNDIHVTSGGRIHTEYKRHSDSTWKVAPTVPGYATSVAIPGVEAGVSYDYRVYCENNTHVTGAFVTLSNQTLASIVSGMLTYRPLTNPLTAHDAGSNVTITVDDFTMRIQGVGDVPYNTNNIGAQSYATKYFVYLIDPDCSGGTQTYYATTTKENAMDGAGAMFIGSITTPAAGAPDTAGNNDGGIGAQGGGTNVFLFGSFTTWTSVGVINDPSHAIDANIGTSAEVIAPVGSAVATGATLELSGMSSVAAPWKSLTLHIYTQVATNTVGAGTYLVRLDYSLDGGLTYTDVYVLDALETRGFQDDQIELPTGMNLGLLRVRLRANKNNGAGGQGIIAELFEAPVIGMM